MPEAITINIPDKFFSILRETWGFESLRPSQHAAISSILEGRDTLVVMPTGVPLASLPQAFEIVLLRTSSSLLRMLQYRGWKFVSPQAISGLKFQQHP